MDKVGLANLLGESPTRLWARLVLQTLTCAFLSPMASKSKLPISSKKVDWTFGLPTCTFQTHSLYPPAQSIHVIQNKKKAIKIWVASQESP